MDWLKSSLQAAQKQAQEAAEKAKALAQQAQAQAQEAAEKAKLIAQQATQQAKVLAEQATEKAKVLATAAAEEAQSKFGEAQTKLQELASATAKTVSNSSAPGDDADSAELTKYGVTPGLLETISGMTYSTFSDYPLELLPSTNPMGLSPPIPPPGFRLSAWQERHAVLVLSRGDQLQGLRFALCPKTMSEELFWVIYFTLVKSLLPAEAFDPTAEARSQAAGSSLGAGLGSRSRLTSSNSLATEPRNSTLASAASSSKHLVGLPVSTSSAALAASAAAGAAATAAGAAAAAASPGPPAGASGGAAAAGGEAELLNGSSSSSVSGSGSDDDDDGGGDADLDALEDDPELAAYLNEALDLGEGGEGEGLSDLGSAVDDLDDYINALDEEGAGSGDGDGDASSPAVSPSKSQD